MNKALQKKLLSYSALVTALLAVGKSANAQIVYTRLSPPDTLAGHDVSQHYFLDLNNDGINDFEFNVNTVITSSDNAGYNTFLSRFIYAKGLGKNKVGTDTVDNNKDSICNNKWQTYNSLARYTLKIHNSTSSRTSHRFFNGYFFGNTGKYLPLKLIVDSNIYYGWARISIDSSTDTLLIWSYAYDSIPNECIAAGDTGSISTAVQKIPEIRNEVSIWSYNKNVTVKLDNENLIGSIIEIYNTLGQLVYSSTLHSNQTNIELADLSLGIYTIRVSGKQSTIVKKTMIE